MQRVLWSVALVLVRAASLTTLTRQEFAVAVVAALRREPRGRRELRLGHERSETRQAVAVALPTGNPRRVAPSRT